MKEIVMLWVLIPLCLISFHSHAFEQGISWSGSGVGYSTATKGYFGVGAVYEKAFSEKWVFGAGASALFSEYVTVYGPQLSGKYFFENYTEGKWHVSVLSSYNFYDVKSDSYSCECQRVSIGAALMYQWTFGVEEQKYFSVGVGSGLQFNRFSLAFDLGFKF